jgi:hypothetical protein
MNHNNVISLPVGASALVAHQRVRLAAGLVVAAGASDKDCLGHVLQDTVAGGTADIAIKFASGMHYAIASAAINNGDAVTGAAGGKIVAGAAGVGGDVAVALSGATGDGSIIRIIYVGSNAGT